MKTYTLTLTLLSLLAACSAQAPDAGGVAMDRLMAMKLESRKTLRANRAAAGGSDSARRVVGKIPCLNGFAGVYPCKGIDLHSVLTHAELGSASVAVGGGEGSDAWGWTSSTGREFGAITQTDGTAFVEINAEGTMKYLGRLPTQTVTSLWRDAKSVGSYMIIGAESQGHGVQIFDMRKLLDASLQTAPKVFSTLTDVTVFKSFSGTNCRSPLGNTHNIINSASNNMVIAVGMRSCCGGGPLFIDITNPLAPKYAGCYSGDGYTHDAQAVIYNGPDARYKGREILFAYNEDTLTILDITVRSNVVLLSRTPYPGSAYTHQGWLTDASHTHLLLDDELDESDRTSSSPDGRTATYVWNISSLTAPFQEGIYKSPVTSIDHNQYVVNGLSYQANYASGLRVVDVTGVATGGGAPSMREVAFFDVRPEDNAVDFFGAWNAYPYFKSGYILINSIERGAFIVKRT